MILIVKNILKDIIEEEQNKIYMVIIAIVVLLAVFIYGILEMNKSSKKISKDKIRELTTAEKNAAVGIVKSYWRVSMILLAIIIGFMVIMISQIIGKTVIYSNAVSVITMVYSLIAYVIITINKKKMENEFNKIMKQQEGESDERKNSKNFRI